MRIAVLFVALATVGCYATDPAPPTCNPVIEECNPADYPPLPPLSGASCKDACDHLEAAPPAGLGCKLKPGVCLTNCQRVQRATYRACLYQAKTCGDVDACD